MKLQGWLMSFSTRREGQAGDYLHFSACGSGENKKHEAVLKRSQGAEGSRVSAITVVSLLTVCGMETGASELCDSSGLS